tara:strand:- start:7 stop:363 length:357 start_codon:yes stop_codon:yes gene_type:complete
MTAQQERFLDALFGEALGDYRRALDMAGYTKNTKQHHIIKSLKDEIIERAEYMLAVNAPKAVLGITGILDEPSALGNREKLAASKEILDRVGLVRTEKVQHTVTASSVIILPELEVLD